MTIASLKTVLTTSGLAMLAAGCVAGPAPSNFASAQYAPQQRVDAHSGASAHPDGAWLAEPAAGQARACTSEIPAALKGYRQVDAAAFSAPASPLAPGDRVAVRVLGDSNMLTGTYVVGSDGTIRLKGAEPVAANGNSLAQLEGALRDRLIGAGIVRKLRNAVAVSLVKSAGVPVAVAGAVFDGGAVLAGQRSADDRLGLKEGAVSGDANAARSVATAIRAAGGVRPDADVQRIYLVRGGQFAALDLSGMVSGHATSDVGVTAGDRIIVPVRDCFDPQLVRPTPLTAPGIRVFMSNLTRSANNNAGAAIGHEKTLLPYGTRLLQALVAANCVGGSYMQSDRRAVLISRNWANGRSVAIERDIEKLVRRADRDDYDPYLMPGDAIVCYDSRWTNFSEAVGIVSQGISTVTPAILLDNAL